MKMISIDDFIKYCDIERAAYKANNCGAACTALRRVAEFAKENAVEAEPVKRGRWIKVIGENYECSNCKAALWVRKVNPISNYKYCWSCGYKMDGDSDDQP